MTRREPTIYQRVRDPRTKRVTQRPVRQFSRVKLDGSSLKKRTKHRWPEEMLRATA